MKIRSLALLSAATMALSLPASLSAQRGNGNTGRRCEAATGMLAAPFYEDCQGSFQGNINGSASELTNLGTFFGGTWLFVNSYTVSPAGNSGTFTFQQAITTRFVLGLKAGNFYSFYLYDPTGSPGGATSEFWQTIGTAANRTNGGADLSHLSLYVERTQSGGNGGTGGGNGGGGTGTPVPEPSTLALMAAGLLGLGVVARRRHTR